jgi:hypothetical protein
MTLLPSLTMRVVCFEQVSKWLNRWRQEQVMAKQHASAQQDLAQAHRRERAPLIMCGAPNTDAISGLLLSL